MATQLESPDRSRRPRAWTAAALVALLVASTLALALRSDDDSAEPAGVSDTTSTTSPPTTSTTVPGGGRAWSGQLDRVDDGGLRADGFDRWLRDNPTTSPEEAARTLVGVPTAATSTVVDGSTATVIVTLDTVGDDSVSGTRYTLRFSIDGDVVISFDGGTWADRCARGADTESYAPRLCP